MIDLSDLASLVVAAEEGDPCREAHGQAHQERHCLPIFYERVVVHRRVDT